MKRTFTLSLLTLAALVFTFSCQKPAERIEPASDAPTLRTFTFTFAEPDSKVSISDAGKTAWEEGDEILIHAGADGDESVIVTLSAGDISADGKQATITVEGLDPYDREDAGYLSKYYAIYPASAVTSSKPLYYNTRIDDFSIPAMGGCDDGAGNISFRLLCGVITFQVSGDFDTFSFEGNNGETITYVPQCQWRVAHKTSGSFQFELKLTSDGAQCGAQSLISAPVSADGSTVNYVCIPNGANLSGGFIFKFYKAGILVKVAKTLNGVNIPCGSLLSLGDISGQLKDGDSGDTPTDPGNDPAEPANITIDGDMSDWDEIQGAVGEGGYNAAFKVASDQNNIYFYVKRTMNRFGELWAGAAYHYYTFDLDGNASTGTKLWGNGPYEMLLVIYPYAGSADAPVIGFAGDGAAEPSTCTVANAVIMGKVVDDGVETEVSIPRADLLPIPSSPVTVYYWSNKGGSEKLSVNVAL